MARIVDTAITITSRTSTIVTLQLGVDTLFSASEVQAGRNGSATFAVKCDIWDEDTFSDDHITRSVTRIEPGGMVSRVGVDFPFELKLIDLRRHEPSVENTIELYGEFSVLKNNQRIAPTVKTRTRDVSLPGPPPATSNNGQRISVTTEGTGPSTVAVVKGTKFTPGANVVIRFTDRQLNQLRSVATAEATGEFIARRGVPCGSGVSFTVTAFEDANPTGSFANAVVMSCP